MTDRPILFSAPMVRALLAGTKTQTRRIIKHRGKRPSLFDGTWTDAYVLDPGNEDWRQQDIPIKVGDRLWVKETWSIPDAYLDGSKPDLVIHKATPWATPGSWRSPLFMPKWASRITLLVDDVKVERLQDISEDDAIAEGLQWVAPTWGVAGVADSWNGDARDSYRGLWEHINGEGSWAANPWVYAVTFRTVLENIDHIGGGRVMVETDCAWFEMSWCDEHQDTACDCGSRYRTWRLKCAGDDFGAAIQQFASGSFYGTWECGGGGRTGPMSTLEECKAKVMKAVGRAA